MSILTVALEYIKKHTPEDNGDTESFHSSIKTDYIWSFEFKDYSEASVAIEKTFKNYNEYRPHSSIDYLSLREFRRRFLEDQSFKEKYKKKLETKLNENEEKCPSFRDNRSIMAYLSVSFFLGYTYHNSNNNCDYSSYDNNPNCVIDTS